MYKFFRNALILAASSFALAANAAPMAYSVNSDSGDPSTEDSLFLIDLETGHGHRRGELATGVVDDVRRDTEGLAFSSDGTLWGIDDNSRSLFPINLSSGSVSLSKEIQLPNFQAGGSNDFGMTFDCEDNLFVTSVATRTLYQVEMNGTVTAVGSQGALGANISAIAAIGRPTQLYGLGNGQNQDGETDAPNLYSIDVDTGVATMIGPLGASVGAYNQGGLAFDFTGNLWAITDRRIINNSIEDLPSQILSIDMKTGQATVVSNTSKVNESGEVGFESLAIGPPGMCSAEERLHPYAEKIPTLSASGRILGIVLLMIAGFVFLRRQHF